MPTQTNQTAQSKDIKISIAMDRDLAEAFKKTAKANNRNQSILIRDFVQEYVKKHGQMSLGL